jgi:hypothetical protein
MRTSMRLASALEVFARPIGSGSMGSNLGCWMHNRNCRAPDISFISRA